MGDLSDKINGYTEKDFYPFHMPGHKRNLKFDDNIFRYDLTEIDGFDNLHNATGIIADINNKAEVLYNSKNSFIMVNGSTGGILSAISSISLNNKRLLIARNSHKSAYNGVFLNRLKTAYLYPQSDSQMWINGAILPDDVEKQLTKYDDICGVFITSPTYEGVVSDIQQIVQIAHKYNVPVIVDEAHGAHFCMNDYFPISAVDCGADIVIQSLHKTLPSVTQTGIIHCNSSLVNLDKLKYFLTVYQTSSPSYLFMISIENCIDMMLNKREGLFSNYINLIKEFRSKCISLENLKLYNGSDNYDYDKSRIVISTKGTNISGFELYNILQNKYRIQLEMALYGHVIAITSCMDTNAGFERLYNALADIDKTLSVQKSVNNYIFQEAKTYIPIFEAASQTGEQVDIENAEGLISCEFLYVYPPGIPMIAPGEIITEDHIKLYNYYRQNGAQLTGNSKQGYISVIADPEWR